MSGMRKKRKLRGQMAEAEAAVAERAEQELAGEDGGGMADGGEAEVVAAGAEMGEGEMGEAEDAEGEMGEAEDAESEMAGAEDAEGEMAGAEDAEGDQDAADDLGIDVEPDAELQPPFMLSPARLKRVLESLLFAAERPLSMAQLKQLSGEKDASRLETALDELMEEYRERGVVLHDVAGGYQFRTSPENSEYVQRLVAGRPVRLSRAQLETLAIIAYRQPVTRPEIDEIRGVDSGSTLKILVDRSLIRILGKKEEPGRPLLYGTSKEFLEFFNLHDLRDLPTLREFHELSEESMREVEELDQKAGGADADEGGEPGEGGGAPPQGAPPVEDEGSSASAIN